jgi:hypothetical protein
LLIGILSTDPPRSSSCSRVSGEEYNGDLQEQDYDQHEDSEDTEQEKDEEEEKATYTEDEEGKITEEDQGIHMGVNFDNRKASAAGLDPQLVDLAIQMMLAGQVDIPAKVYREYQKRKEVSLNCDDIFLDLLPNYTVSQGSSYLATRTGSEYHYRPPNHPPVPLRVPSVGRPPAENKVANEASGTWLRRRMGIHGNLSASDQNKAASYFYRKVKELSGEELDQSFAWYMDTGKGIKMIESNVFPFSQ